MHHLCPSCGQPYGCPRGETECGSPYVFDCHYCYLTRHWRELQYAVADVADRFGIPDGCAGFGDFCHAH